MQTYRNGCSAPYPRKRANHLPERRKCSTNWGESAARSSKTLRCRHGVSAIGIRDNLRSQAHKRPIVLCFTRGPSNAATWELVRCSSRDYTSNLPIAAPAAGAE
eukprot:6489519-Amphidinium_carterae.1